MRTFVRMELEHCSSSSNGGWDCLIPDCNMIKVNAAWVVVLVEGDVSGSPGSLCEPHQSFSFPGLHTGDMLQAAKKGDGVCVSL